MFSVGSVSCNHLQESISTQQADEYCLRMVSSNLTLNQLGWLL
jgi:hypothetical protein